MERLARGAACLLVLAACSSRGQSSGPLSLDGGTGGASTGGSLGAGGSGASGSGGTGGSIATGGAGGAGSTACQSDTDCAYLGRYGACLPPGAMLGQACGVPCAPNRACETDADCGGDVCLETVLGSCCSAGSFVPAGESPYDTECRPRCTAGSCGDGERCASNGHCEPLPCTDGYSCAPDQTCDAAAPGADPHGCANVLCDAGYRCLAQMRCAKTPESFPATHGCERIPCSASPDCATGVCVNGSCYDAAGHCVDAPPAA